MQRLTFVIIYIASVFCLISTNSLAKDWPQLRGPNGDHISDESNLPTTWGDDKNIAWKANIPGRGWSAPIVWGDKVFVTTVVPEKETEATDERDRGPAYLPKPIDAIYTWEVHCLDYKTGRHIWKQVARTGNPSIPTHNGNTYASETPVTDGKRVYAYFGMMGLYAFDFEGKLAWQKNLGVYKMQKDWGTSSSPVLHDGLLYLQIDNEEQSFLIALETKTGNEKWRVEREDKTSWSSPIIWKNKMRTEIVTSNKIARSYDVKTGDLLWQLDMGGGRSSNLAVANESLLYIGNEQRRNGGGGTFFAVKPGASGDITPAEGETTSEGVAWSQPKSGVSMPSPLVSEGHVYILERRRGVLNCYNAETGEEVYKTRVEGAKAFWASPWAYDGKIFCLDDTGTTHVVQAGAEFKVLATNSITDTFWSSSAISNGRLLLRSVNHLYCVQE